MEYSYLSSKFIAYENTIFDLNDSNDIALILIFSFLLVIDLLLHLLLSCKVGLLVLIRLLLKLLLLLLVRG
jgi:hypothetical protein